MSLIRAKSANAAFTYTAFGMVREHEKKESINVPEMMKYLILNYYLLDDTFKPSDGIKLKQFDKVALSLSQFSPVTGSIVINEGDEEIAEFEWKLKVRLVANATNRLVIGVDNPTSATRGMFCFDSTGMWYCREYTHIDSKRKACFMPTREIIGITMRLHLSTKTLSFESDGIRIFECELNKDGNFAVKECRLSIIFGTKGMTAEIVDFAIKQSCSGVSNS